MDLVIMEPRPHLHLRGAQSLQEIYHEAARAPILPEE
jgi:hypothetical protein